MKRRHKWVIGSFGSIVIIFMIVVGVLLYSLFVQQNIQYTQLNEKINDLRSSTQSQINLLSEDLLETQQTLEQSQEEISLLKASTGDDFSGIYNEAVESVVIVSTNIGQGSGFIVDGEGYIVTNYHVIAGATTAGIYTSDATDPYQVSLIGSNSFMDIALLKIEGNFDELEFGDSDDVQVSEKVIAIGNPYGLQFSATSGSVSQIHREGPNGIEAYTQIDVAINPGNSGGPLINNQGKVIGMINFKISNAEGIGFALESNYIKDIVNQIAQQELNQTLI